MKTALTNEGKARFVSQHLGFESITNKSNYKDPAKGILTQFDTESKESVITCDFSYYLCQPENCLIFKTPLSLITDEDKIELCNILEVIDCKYFLDSLEGYERYSINTLKTIQAYKHLKSKGYAVPDYCPIAKRIVTVEEQVEAGWITLKTERLIIKDFACLSEDQDCTEQCSRCKFVEQNLKTN